MNTGSPLWHASILTLYPDMFPGPLGYSLAGQALARGVWSMQVHSIREAAQDKHKTVDDRPFGGGAGMVMRPDVLGAAIEAACATRPFGCMLYFSPRGEILTQSILQELLTFQAVLMLCGRYEGVDQRVLDTYHFREISLGDFVLSGGEMAAYACLDGCVRLLPGVIRNPAALEEESFSCFPQTDTLQTGLLEYPHYTRPAIWRGQHVPGVLRSGDHARIHAWRLAQSRAITQTRRPDMWHSYRAAHGLHDTSSTIK